MVSLTSVSPLLYASPNISCQTASLIDTHQTSWARQRRPRCPMSAASTGDSQCFRDEGDEGSCTRDGDDDPDDDLIRGVFVKTAQERSDGGVKAKAWGFYVQTYELSKLLSCNSNMMHFWFRLCLWTLATSQGFPALSAWHGCFLFVSLSLMT